MALTIDEVESYVTGDRREVIANVDFDDSYPVGGEPLTPANLGFSSQIFWLVAEDQNGFRFEYDRANEKLIARDKPWVDTPIRVKDADGAAAAGVLVYAHIDEVVEQGSSLAHLEFVSPTNADGTGTLYSGGPTYYIQDDDAAATGGFAVYLDEDATLGSRLLAATTRNCHVNVGGGRFLKITNHADPATLGVAIYFDEDAANTYDRLQFVSPTNADGAETSKGEVDSVTNLSALTDVRINAVGR